MLKALLLSILLFPVMGFAEDFTAGKDFEVLESASPKSSNQVKVTEFFSYGCPWCYRLEPNLEKWVAQQGNTIKFNRVPVVFKPDWGFYAKAYYASHLLGLGDKLNPVLFKTIQIDKTPLNSNEAMINFFISQGVDKDIAESAFTHSTTIDMKVGESNGLMAKYRVNAVPALIVNGQYKIDLQMAKSEERLFKILDYLVAQTKAGKTA
ncbi:thiol:disulfide interchange protein DsbA/DsbL [Legionella sp. 16cNR16C]|nr:thiol:disulfide interchange protein DsbA/DsbL [Legionella sp. 16cNR16C]MCE3045519.1 thiol:disulfide interchange protein DsbA/DsbL [Legionella sp. 16cNR16C]